MEKSTSRRFFLKGTKVPDNIEVGQVYQLDQSEAEIFFQLTKVFRLAPGQEIILLNQDVTFRSENTEFHFTTITSNKKTIELKLTGKKDIQSSLTHQLTVGLCLPNKPAKLDFILEKVTELGVSEIRLIKSELSQYHHELKPDRLQKIVAEAAEQSEQPSVPVVSILKNIEEYLAQTKPNSFIAVERGEDRGSILDATPDGPTSILIGPEGGFSEKEVQLFQNPHHKINLGGSILKMDTAALISIGILSLKLQKSSS